MNKWIYRILMAVCIVVFVYAGWQLVSIWNTSRQIDRELDSISENVTVTTEDDKNVLDPDWQALQKENADIVGWVYVPGTGISFPVVQAEDNEYYLNHTFKKEANDRGAIFLDWHAGSDFSSDNSIIFGHSVDVGGMFTSLDKFEDKAFFESHPYFYILTPEANYKCPIWTFAKTTEYTAYYDVDFGDYTEEVLAEMLELSTFHSDVDPAGYKLVSLSTCDLDYGFHSYNRLVLTGLLQRTSEPVCLED